MSWSRCYKEKTYVQVIAHCQSISCISIKDFIIVHAYRMLAGLFNGHVLLFPRVSPSLHLSFDWLSPNVPLLLVVTVDWLSDKRLCWGLNCDLEFVSSSSQFIFLFFCWLVFAQKSLFLITCGVCISSIVLNPCWWIYEHPVVVNLICVLRRNIFPHYSNQDMPCYTNLLNMQP